jgi:hypothetical protein
MYRYGWESNPHTLKVIMAGGIDRYNPKVSIWFGINVGLIPIHIDTLGLHLSMPPATITSNVCGLDSNPY